MTVCTKWDDIQILGCHMLVSIVYLVTRRCFKSPANYNYIKTLDYIFILHLTLFIAGKP